MTSTGITHDAGGAAWRRWEPHIHTPGTALSDRYGAASMDDFLAAVEAASPAIEVLGVTDYLLTRRYEEVVAQRAAGRLPGVALVFCNIEMRLSIETRAGKAVNLHLLVSPDDPDHVTQLNRFLSNLTFTFASDRFKCTPDDLRRLGQAHDPGIEEPETALQAGVNQFKVDFNQLRQLYQENAWAQANILIAVAGSSNDGTAGLQDESAGFAATRKGIEAFAQVIFSATPKSVTFWRGEGVLNTAELAARYGGAKPCLQGSDAHSIEKVGNPDLDRRCWIKGDPTFEALTQACLEPRQRVHLGASPPVTDAPFGITSVATPTLPWLVGTPQSINSGMVAIIGSRGSGKTALADLIAHAGDSAFPTDNDQSFLSRARPFLGSAEVVATWSNDQESRSSLDAYPSDMPDIHYLTQQFVDRLCSSVAESDELLREIERVVFAAHSAESRLGAEDFAALVDLRSSETQLAVDALNQRLDRLSSDLLVEREWWGKRSQLAADLKKTKEDLSKIDAARKAAMKPGGEVRAAYYTRISDEIANRTRVVQDLSRRVQNLNKLTAEATRVEAETLPQIQADFKAQFGENLLNDANWTAFLPQFTVDYAGIANDQIVAEQAKLELLMEKAGVAPNDKMTVAELQTCSLNSLRAEQTTVGEQIGVDQKNTQRLRQLTEQQSAYDARRLRLEHDSARANQSEARIEGILAERAKLYERFFNLISEQCAILEELYEPLSATLASSTSAANKLRLEVVRSVDIGAWARTGEALLDLRKNGSFRGRGALLEAASPRLLEAWQTGTASDVASAMEAFRREFNQAFADQSAVERGSEGYGQWAIELGRWLYSTEHVSVHYSIQYEGVPITQLSPGTRGIVLLLLYLALDVEDARPLIIDQPEENLDPRSIYTELVELFKQARQRRQIIIVTHNANLVVNTDVDQVIVASCIKPASGSPPTFTYASGGLENPAIRAAVCDILEGGEVAFKQRARRLRVDLAK